MLLQEKFAHLFQTSVVKTVLCIVQYRIVAKLLRKETFAVFAVILPTANVIPSITLDAKA